MRSGEGEVIEETSGEGGAYPLGAVKDVYDTAEERPIRRPRLRGLTVIAWVNKEEMFSNLIIRTITTAQQIAEFDLQVIPVLPDAGCTNIGQAYNLGLERAIHETKLYIHQDCQVADRHFLEKLHRLLDRPKVGAAGLVGSTKDTGGAYFHAPLYERRGAYWGGFYPEAARVAVVDGLMFATRLSIPWCEDYEGPHMAVEDMCMRVRAAGQEVWTIAADVYHYSPGTVDDGYYRSVETFQRNWAHVLPPGTPTAVQLAAQERIVMHHPVRIQAERIGASDGAKWAGTEVQLVEEKCDA